MDASDHLNENAQLSSLLHQYHARCRQGQVVSVESLCANNPQLAPALERLLMVESLLNQAAKDPLVNTPGPANCTEAAQGQRLQRNAAPKTDRYEVLGELGAGGMGVVYHVHDRNLKRDVALKVIHPKKLTPELRRRFQTEAHTLAKLDHPNIVRVYDVGEWSPPGAEAAPYLALEYVAGGSLWHQMDTGPMDVREAAKLVRLLARAMAHAHAQGVVHRDLKPSNVLFAKMADESGLNCVLGCPKVTDFGLAKDTDAPNKTRSGVVLGTPSYMSPEQAKGKTNTAGPPADVYALGVILYELLTTRVPFLARTTAEVLACHIYEKPKPVRQLRPEVPAELDAICLACLSKDQNARPTSAELGKRLESFLERPISSTPTRRRMWLVVAIAVLALVLTGVTWALWFLTGGVGGG